MRSVRAFALLAVSVAAVAAARPEPAGPVKLSKAEAARVVAGIEKARAEARAWLKSDPSSYLAAVGRQDFGSSTTLSVGTAPESDVRLDAPGVAPRHLRVSVKEDLFLVEAVDAEARFIVKGQEVRQATVGPSSIGIGRLSLRLSHQGFPAILVLDPQSPHFRKYKERKYYRADLAYRFELSLTRNERPDTVTVLSTRGNQRRALRLGWFDFLIGGKPYRLEAVRLLEPGVEPEDLSVFFRDATSGTETYPLGRYVDAKVLPSGLYLLDFNLAYNPACAFSDHYNCPLPPKANNLPAAIRAGEMDTH